MRKHTRGRLRLNPPSRTSKADGPTVRATIIGKAQEIRYTRDGATYRHKFRSGITLAVTETDQLVITGPGLKTRLFIED
jgi:hypothetical protein